MNRARKNKSLALYVCLCFFSWSLLRALGASGLFPKMPSATTLYVVEIEKDTDNAKMTSRALQGMLNQTSAEVYLINNWWDREPLEYCAKPSVKPVALPGANAGLRTLFKQYQAGVKRMFVYDPEKDWTWYLALMSAAQQEGIPVTESIRNDLVLEFGWNGEVIDFRNRWANRIEAYRWAIERLLPGCDRKVVFALGKGDLLTDYAVASKGFVFWLDFEAERSMIEEIFKTAGYGVGCSLMGYGSNGDQANATANPFGIGYITSSLYANGSFWSSFPNKTYTQAFGKAVAAEPGKIYASITWSDGDNLEFDQNPIYKFWHDPARGKIPVATPLSPALQELNSPLLDWYYSRMTANDELMAGPTGAQFVFIQDFKDELFPAWCELTRVWCRDAGFHAGRIWLAPYGSAKYITYMKTCGFTGLFGEGAEIRAGFPIKIDTTGVANKEQFFKELMALKPDPRAPRFVSFTPIVGGFYVGDHGYTAIKEQIDRVEAAFPGRYVFLLPKDQFATIRTYYETRLPSVSGSPDRDEGLTATEVSSNSWSKVEHNGRRCWLVPKGNPANTFSMQVSKDFRPETGKALRIDLAYLDSGSGSITLDYDSADTNLPGGGAYKRSSSVVRRMNSGQWKLAQFYVSDARFGSRESEQTDIRFAATGDDLLISGVQVQRLNR